MVSTQLTRESVCALWTVLVISKTQNATISTLLDFKFKIQFQNLYYKLCSQTTSGYIMQGICKIKGANY